MYRLTDFQELDRLERIRMGFSQLHKREEPKEVSKAMGFFDELSDFTRGQVDSFLPDCKKNIFEHINFKPEERYATGKDEKFSWVENVDEKTLYTVCCDAPLSFGLQQNDVPITIASFFPRDDQTVMIYQHQGINPYLLEAPGKPKLRFDGEHRYPVNLRNKFLRGLDYKSYSLSVISNLSKKLDYDFIAYQSAQNNPATQPDFNDQIHLPFERAFKLYDEFALLNGFEYGSDGNLYKSLK